jgi:hypothetical protein
MPSQQRLRIFAPLLERHHRNASKNRISLAEG